MHRSESEELSTCVVCGAEVSIARDRAFAAGSRTVLCYDCATRRGGIYDEAQDRWLQEADLRGLADGED